MFDKVPENPRFPHTILIKRSTESGNPFEEGTEVELYSGCGRAYTKSGVRDGLVDYALKMVSLPVRYDGWEEGNVPKDGDYIKVTIGSNSEEGRVFDSRLGSNNTLIAWRRNEV